MAMYRRALGLGNRNIRRGQEPLVFQTKSSAPFPLNTGDVLARLPIAEANKEMYFPFVIAFGEPGVFKGNPVIPTLYQIAQLIRNIVRDFDSRGVLK